MHVTQSALSGLIKELEQTLGARVVDRSTRRIVLTEIGRELYPLFSQMIDDLDGALANVADHTQLRKGVVRIAAPQLMCCTLVPEAMAAYRACIRTSMSGSPTAPVENVIARVLSGESDFGIGPERDPCRNWKRASCSRCPFRWCSRRAIRSKRPRVTWQDVARYPFIALQGQFTERLLADMQALLRDVPLKPANEVTFMTTALAMVSAGLGITVCLPYAEPLVQLYRLHMRPLEEPG
jgi:DNA-binding transcriptional LysR family regulator